MKRLYLQQIPNLGPGDKYAYRVIKVVNSTDVTVGEVLPRAFVDDLCEFSQWDVTITAGAPKSAGRAR